MAKRISFRKIVIGPKVDLDACGAILLRLVDPATGELPKEFPPVEVVRGGQASEADLRDLSVLCIEVGGAGKVSFETFDHHEADGPSRSATWQAFERLLEESQWDCEVAESHDLGPYGPLPCNWCPAEVFEAWDQLIEKFRDLAEYIDLLDTQGPKALGQERGEGHYLSDLFAGMLLTERDPVEQVKRGVELLSDFASLKGIDPFSYRFNLLECRNADLYLDLRTGELWKSWLLAKAVNDRQLVKALEAAQWTTTRQGRRLAHLETSFFGAPGALYAHGAEVVVAFNPTFGNPPAPKFTVAGNGIKVDAALPALCKLEPGWGGPATGTILGSPREGSKLSLKQVVGVVKETL